VAYTPIPVIWEKPSRLDGYHGITRNANDDAPQFATCTALDDRTFVHPVGKTSLSVT
ncbi:hypothetical protein WUBG_08893, partial [Wuchereria bancrofti]